MSLCLCVLTACGSSHPPNGPGALLIANKTVPNGVVQSPYSVTMVAIGGQAPFAWTLNSGTLPPGLSLSPQGVISGTPPITNLDSSGNAKTYNFVIRVTDSQMPTSAYETGSFSITIYKAAHSAGVKPIIGVEAYMAGESRFERPLRRGRLDDTGGDADEGDKLYYHLTLLAESDKGYKNLLKLSSEAYLSGYWYKPRCDWELLERYHEGVIATTGCLGGLVNQALLRGDVEQATAHAARLQEIFGRDNLFVELQDHGLEKQRKTNPQLVEIAKAIGAPLLATNDSHYTTRDDHLAHDALLCVQTGSTMDDPKRFRFEGSEHYMKTSAEMRALFSELPAACDNTLWVAERADVTIELGKPKLPAFPLPEGFASSDDYLRYLSFRGAEARYGSPVPANVVERLEFELGVIASMGFSDYFLVCWDLIRHARTEDTGRAGRGSAAGCCVAYCLRIVDVDPIRYDLLFERFLNPGRKQMPDIDMDFDERYRGEMIRYASERWGSDHVAQIVTFSTIKARARGPRCQPESSGTPTALATA